MPRMPLSIEVFGFVLALNENACVARRRRGSTHSPHGCVGVRISESKRSFVA